MPVMIQVKDVPEDVHRVLKARAALAGVSLSEYVRQTLAAAAARPSRAELIADLAQIELVPGAEPAAVALAHIRDDLA